PAKSVDRACQDLVAGAALARDEALDSGEAVSKVGPGGEDVHPRRNVPQTLHAPAELLRGRDSVALCPEVVRLEDHGPGRGLVVDLEAAADRARAGVAACGKVGELGRARPQGGRAGGRKAGTRLLGQGGAAESQPEKGGASEDALHPKSSSRPGR